MNSINREQSKAGFILYNKYKNELERLAKKCLWINKNNLPFNENDIINYSLAHFLENDLQKFNPNLNIKFECYFFIKIKNNMLNYCRTFHKKNYEIMNNSIEFDDDIENIKNERIHIDFSDLSVIEKSIINKLYYDNYKIKDICNEYGTKQKRIEKMLNKIYNKMKKKSYFY
ncbi:MAG: hypothetical protein ACRDA7_02245 [Metamycoplasmataceae bacterium]